MSGFFLMHRGWQEQPLFGSEPFDRRSAFIWIIENANFADKPINVNGSTVVVKRGQVCASLRYMAKAWKWDEAKVRRFLKRAQSEKIIDAATDAGQTIITICNYEKYQAPKRDADAANDAGATQERRSDDAKYKEGKEGKEKHNYAFSGKVIKLNQQDYDRWAASFSRIDLPSLLQSRDDWLGTQDEKARKNWYNSTSSWLAAKSNSALRSNDVEMPVC
jgi:hypothetical protein